MKCVVSTAIESHCGGTKYAALDKFYPHSSTRPPRLMEIIRRLSQDSSRDVRAFVAFLLVPEEAGQVRHSPVTSATPSMMFATFSRPPPKIPSLIVEVDIQDPGSGDEGSLKDERPQGRSPIVPERDADSIDDRSIQASTE